MITKNVIIYVLVNEFYFLVLGCPNTVFTSPADGSCISNDAGGY